MFLRSSGRIAIQLNDNNSFKLLCTQKQMLSCTT
jgi:hypothetical protein